jgi:phospholipase/carboxylesterase
MLETVEHPTAAAPTWSIVWLHGLGADGHDFAGIVPELVRPDWPGVRFVFPHAPVRPVTINGGMRMRAWYDIRDMELHTRADEEGVRESMAQVEELVAREGERGVPPSRVVLAGFSQGGAIALATGLRRESAFAGVLALSTYLPLGSSTAAEATDAGRRTPVFMGHGVVDPVVRFEWGTASRDALLKLGVPVEWHAYQGMPHAVNPQEIRDIGAWLGARFAAGG